MFTEPAHVDTPPRQMAPPNVVPPWSIFPDEYEARLVKARDKGMFDSDRDMEVMQLLSIYRQLQTDLAALGDKPITSRLYKTWEDVYWRSLIVQIADATKQARLQGKV